MNIIRFKTNQVLESVSNAFETLREISPEATQRALQKFCGSMVYGMIVNAIDAHRTAASVEAAAVKKQIAPENVNRSAIDYRWIKFHWNCEAVAFIMDHGFTEQSVKESMNYVYSQFAENDFKDQVLTDQATKMLKAAGVTKKQAEQVINGRNLAGSIIHAARTGYLADSKTTVQASLRQGLADALLISERPMLGAPVWLFEKLISKTEDALETHRSFLIGSIAQGNYAPAGELAELMNHTSLFARPMELIRDVENSSDFEPNQNDKNRGNIGDDDAPDSIF